MLNRHRGPVAWVNEGDMGVPEAGFYALTKDGKQLAKPLQRLVAVQHPDDNHHYRKAKADEHSPPIGNVIELEVDAEGKGEVEA